MEEERPWNAIKKHSWRKDKDAKGKHSKSVGENIKVLKGFQKR
jgi:hypothetical protein